MTKLLALAFLASLVPAQDPAVGPAKRLHAACAATWAQPDLAYTSRHRRERSYDFRAGRIMPVQSADHETAGRRKGRLLHVRAADEVELLFAGRSMLAKDARRDWQLRQGVRADTSELPFALDPDRLLRLIASLAGQATSRGAGQLDGRPVEYFALNLSGDAARSFAYAGLVPSPKQSPVLRGGRRRGGGTTMTSFGGGRARRRLPEVRVDLLCVVDPATRRVLRVLGRRAEPHRMVGRRGGFGPMGGAEPAPAKPGPVRSLLPALSEAQQKTHETIGFEIRIGATEPQAMPELSPKMRALLGL